MRDEHHTWVGDSCSTCGKLNECRSLFENGMNFLRSKHYRSAFREFDKALRINPQHTDAHYFRGVSFIFLKNGNEAINSFSAAMKLGMTSDTIWNNRGVAYVIKGDIRKAGSDFNEAMSLNPDNTTAQSNSNVAHVIGMFVEAGRFPECQLSYSGDSGCFAISIPGVGH